MLNKSHQEVLNAKAQAGNFDLAIWGQNVGTEARKSFNRWMEEGFLGSYLSGDSVLDIGYKGYGEDAHPILPWAIGIDLDYPGYDGSRLPFPDGSQDAIFNSHTLEHIPNYRDVIVDWFRVLKVGGYLITAVPHQFLYERSIALPSRWNLDHRRFYTAASLLREFEEALDPLSFRVRHLEDNDRDFDYSIPPECHAGGSYEIIFVIEKIQRPAYAVQLLAGEIPPSIADIMASEDRKFIDGLYRLILRREPDMIGLNGYLELLSNGADRAGIVRVFAFSEEAQALGLATPTDVRNFLEACAPK